MKKISSDYTKNLWIESHSLTINNVSSCKEIFFSGKTLNSKNVLSIENIRLATTNLNDIQIGHDENRLSITKSEVKELNNDNMIICRVSKSQVNSIKGKNLKVIIIDVYYGTKKKITIRAPNLKDLIIKVKNYEYELDVDEDTASSILHLEGNLIINEILRYNVCQVMIITSSMCPKKTETTDDISLPCLSVFHCKHLCAKSSYNNTIWVLLCPNIYSFITRGDSRPNHIREVSRIGDTYKTTTVNFVSKSGQVMESVFIKNLANTIVKMQLFLGNEIITNKEVLAAFDDILEHCSSDHLREKVDKRFAMF